MPRNTSCSDIQEYGSAGSVSRRWCKAVMQVGSGSHVLEALTDDGEVIIRYGRQLLPEYTDTDTCLLAPCTYRRILTVLIRRQHVRTPLTLLAWCLTQLHPMPHASSRRVAGRSASCRLELGG